MIDTDDDSVPELLSAGQEIRGACARSGRGERRPGGSAHGV